MDLNPPENLDPKLKEAYERMIGNKTHTPIINKPEMTSERPAINISSPVDEPIHSDYGKVSDENKNISYEQHPKGEHKKLFLLLLTGAIIILLAYGVIWAKIFNLI